MVAARRKPWLLVMLRTVVLALVVPLASSFALPAWVALVAPETHLCHCPKDHSDCHCAKCHTDGDPDLALTTESISGKCGDDDVLFGASRMIAVLPAPVLVAERRRVGRRAPERRAARARGGTSGAPSHTPSTPAELTARARVASRACPRMPCASVRS